MSVVALLEPGALDPARELGALCKQARGDGALVSFVGLARPRSPNGGAVDALILDHHPTLTRQSLEQIAVACAEKFKVSHVRVVHRCGEVASGQPIIFAGAAALHRRAAFDATDYLMDRLKTDAVFWKREMSAGTSTWIEASEADLVDRERWG